MGIQYAVYSVFTTIVFLFLVLITVLIFGFRASLKWIALMLPVFVLFQLYDRNTAFRFPVKSYLFPDRSFECGYGDELPEVTVPLPRRTFLLGKQNVCAPYYFTYSKEQEFKKTYEKALLQLKEEGKILDYQAVARDEQESSVTGFTLKWNTGLSMEIELVRYPVSDGRQLLIHYPGREETKIR